MTARGEVKPKPGLYLAVAATVAAYLLYSVWDGIAERQARLEFICETLTPGMLFDERAAPRVEAARNQACKPAKTIL